MTWFPVWTAEPAASVITAVANEIPSRALDSAEFVVGSFGCHEPQRQYAPAKGRPDSANTTKARMTYHIQQFASAESVFVSPFVLPTPFRADRVRDVRFTEQNQIPARA